MTQTINSIASITIDTTAIAHIDSNWSDKTGEGWEKLNDVREWSKIYSKELQHFTFDEKEAANGTGYYDGLVNVKFDVPHGSILVGFSTETNRRVLLITTSLGNIVYFDRYKDSTSPIVVNAPRSFTGIIANGAQSEDNLSAGVAFGTSFDSLVTLTNKLNKKAE